ncbi:hypothetical protein PMEL1_01359 [Prevotella melaninogenica]|uniref:Uncharacterized protein n=1 Tax=Prevotella melaninogenica TaxID=28132 RepID=A0A250KID0_9BACT|nr:hypothetical protein PMEL1_01359 [Prevotella melaninogenica]
MKRNIFFRENNSQERAYHRLKDYQNFCKQTSCKALKCVKTKANQAFNFRGRVEFFGKGIST